MNNKVDGAHDKRRKKERRNRFNTNTSLKNVKAFRKNWKEINDDGIHHDQTEPEGKHDDGAEDEREDRFYDEVKKGQDERNDHQFTPTCVQNESGDELV